MSCGDWVVQYNPNIKIVHIAPLNDLREHECIEPCWCDPKINKSNIYIHQAKDGRVAYDAY
jgi:hypothetical protein